MRQIPFLLFLLLTQAGCLTTAVWQSATHKHLDLARIEVADRTDTEKPGPLVILVYETIENGRVGLPATEYAVTLPTDPNGQPVWPFVVQGTAVSRQAIVESISPEHLRALKQFRPTAQDHRSAERLLSNGKTAFRTLDEHTSIRDAGFDWVAGGLNAQGHPVALATFKDWGKTMDNTVDSFPPGTRVFIVPEKAIRPAGSRRNAIVGAALVTPITLAADVLTFPLFILAIATGNGC